MMMIGVAAPVLLSWALVAVDWGVTEALVGRASRRSRGTTGVRPTVARRVAGDDNFFAGGEPTTTKAGTRRWRVFNVDVPLGKDPGKDDQSVHPELVRAANAKVAKLCGWPLSSSSRNRKKSSTTKAPTVGAVTIARKAFDGRWRRRRDRQPHFVYTVDVDLPESAGVVAQGGQVEELLVDEDDDDEKAEGGGARKKVLIIGLGPAGLFAAATLAATGSFDVTVVERGQPVERRGRDIGALFARKVLDPESNLCYGEGGAGTWSDGKLTTRIGKNSEGVRGVLEMLVAFGAPERILVDGKPHLGTDRLVRILQAARGRLAAQGVEFKFGCRVEDLVVESGRATGCILEDGRRLTGFDGGVVLAVGHSARALYDRLHRSHSVAMEAKPIACGFRVEHPQDRINAIQYGPAFAQLTDRGRGKVPVADYRLVHQVLEEDGGEEPRQTRAVYSFCMCPGGQVVPTSVDPTELSVNGMSFSKRQSKWANSGVVVSIAVADYARDLHAAGVEVTDGDPLVGVEWQRLIERRAATLGGGDLVCPVQTVPDFLAGTFDATRADLPPSSYRLGVKNAPCHTIYPAPVTEALRAALRDFDRLLPGFVCDEALLHGVESRTSAPVQITREAASLQSPTMPGLYPAGEGAGYAGGIVSAALDGANIAQAIILLQTTTPHGPATARAVRRPTSGSSSWKRAATPPPPPGY